MNYDFMRIRLGLYSFESFSILYFYIASKIYDDETQIYYDVCVKVFAFCALKFFVFE
jgi:hypothetical protein